MTPLKRFQSIATDLSGMTLSHLWRGYGSAVFFEFGKLTPSEMKRADGNAYPPTGEVSLSIEWSWRIEDATSIVCGSWSDEELWEPAFEDLLDRQVTKLALFGRLAEIELCLSGDRSVLSFMTAEGQPEWSVVDRRGPENIWIAMHRGELIEHDDHFIRD